MTSERLQKTETLTNDPRSESAFQKLHQRLSDPSRRRGYLDSSRFHCRNFGLGVALAARDDGAGMTHTAARRRGAAGDEADHRLFATPLGLILEELRALSLRRAADLADHHDRLGRLVGEEHLQSLDKIHAL